MTWVLIGPGWLVVAALAGVLSGRGNQVADRTTRTTASDPGSSSTWPRPPGLPNPEGVPQTTTVSPPTGHTPPERESSWHDSGRP